MSKVLICSPIRDKEYCLKEYLDSIYKLDYPKEKIKIYFVENDSIDKTVKILEEFKDKHESEYRSIQIETLLELDEKKADFKTHEWKPEDLLRLGKLRDRCLNQIEDEEFIFMIDADVILQPETLKRLIGLNLPVVTTLFYSKWKLEEAYPNIGYVKEENPWNVISPPDAYIQFKWPTFKVDVLMAVWLMKTEVIKKYNLSFCQDMETDKEVRMEFKVFCKKCRDVGVEQFCDMVYPARHIEV